MVSENHKKGEGANKPWIFWKLQITSMNWEPSEGKQVIRAAGVAHVDKQTRASPQHFQRLPLKWDSLNNPHTIIDLQNSMCIMDMHTKNRNVCFP